MCALELAKKLEGLPLALATAASYIKETGISFADYMELYDNCLWQSLGDLDEELPEYRDRKLFTTWDMSLARVKQKEPFAHVLVNLLA